MKGSEGTEGGLVDSLSTVDPATNYRMAKPHLDAALDRYERDVKALLNGAISEHYVVGRVKTARSLIRKLRQNPANPRTWESITDKVGVRVICTTLADCDRAAELISGAEWTVLSIDRKQPAKYDRLFYPGIHVDLAAADVLDHTGAAICCEVQIRTRAQDAWAVASHKLTYKGFLKPPKKMRRLVVRLTIMVELFDEEVQRLFNKRTRLPRYAEARVLEHLESVFEGISGDPAEAAKDLSIVAVLMNAYDDAERADVTVLVDDFCGAHEELSALVQGHSFNADSYQDRNDWLFTQPEVLIVLERAYSRPFRLLHAIEDTDLEEIVRAVCITAGKPLPIE